MPPDMKQMWEREYSEKKLPTSTRIAPSRALEFLQAYIAGCGSKLAGPILDLGCGRGRNAIALAKSGITTFGMDIADNALDDFRKWATQEGVADRAIPVHARIDSSYPFPSDCFRNAICLTSLENLTDDSQIMTLVAETTRVLVVCGHLLLYLIMPQDSYYEPLIMQKPGRLLVQRSGGPPQRIFTLREIARFFEPRFTIKANREFSFADVIDGNVCQRKLMGIILRKSTPETGSLGCAKIR